MQLHVPIAQIEDNPWQTRQSYDDTYIVELASDIYRNGLIQLPAGRLVFRTAAEERVLDNEQIEKFAGQLGNEKALRVQLAVGHNRLRAFKLLAGPHLDKIVFEQLVALTGGNSAEFLAEAKIRKWDTIPVNIAAFDDPAMSRMAWSENAQRKDLTPLEEAKAIRKAMMDFGWTQTQAGTEFGLARATVANKLRILEHLPDEVLNHLHTGAISERQASALLPLYQLPKTAVEAAENKPKDVWSFYPPKELIQRAIDGASSDSLREFAERTINHVLMPLEECPFPPHEQIVEGKKGVQQGRCTNCPQIVTREKKKFCADRHCYELKAEGWEAFQLGEAQVQTSLKYLPKSTQFWSCEDFGFGDQEPGEQIVVTGCPRDQLRLYYDPERTSGVRVPGHEAVRIVCDKGSGNSCYCLQKLKRENAKPDPAAEAEKEAKKRLEKEIVTPAVTALKQALVAMDPEAWRIVLKSVSYGLQGNILDGDWDKAINHVARRVVSNKVPWNGHEHLDRSRAAIDEALTKAGIQPDYPADTPADPMPGIRRRFERVQLWIDRLPRELTTAAAVRGNLDNLERIQAELDALPNEMVEELFYGQVGIARELLTNLHPILLSAPDLFEGFGDVNWLVHTPPGDANFKSKLSHASAGVVRYAYAIVRSFGYEGHKIRREALERRLRELEVTAVPDDTPAPANDNYAVAWLRSYVDDSGRTWQNLEPNQTHHANSPCFQAFTRAFPDEAEPKWQLKQARAILERETAVVQEVSA